VAGFQSLFQSPKKNPLDVILLQQEKNQSDGNDGDHRAGHHQRWVLYMLPHQMTALEIPVKQKLSEMCVALYSSKDYEASFCLV